MSVFLALAAAWAFMAGLIFVVPEMTDKIILNRIKMVFVHFIPLSIFLVFANYHFERSLRKIELILLAIIPFIGAMLNLSSWYEAVITDYDFLEVATFNILTFKNGPWYYIHDIYSRLLIAAPIVYFALTFGRSSAHVRSSMMLFSIAIFLPFVADSIAVFYAPFLRFIQITPAAMAFMAAFMVFAILRRRIHEVVHYAHKMVFEESDDLVVVLDPEGYLLDYNQTAANVFELSSGSLKTKFNTQIESEFHHHGEIYLRHSRSLKDGRTNVGEVVHFKNITAQRKVIQELNELNRVKTLLLGVIGHDIQSHQSSLALLAENLSQTALQNTREDLQAEAEHIFQCAREGIEFVDQTLTWSKAQLGRTHIQATQIQITPLIGQVIQFLTPALQVKNLEVDVQQKEVGLECFGDVFSIGVILRNLLSNAIKWSPDHSVIRLRVYCVEGELLIEVEDQGPGLSEESFREIMNNGIAQNSNGLGLLLCRDFLKLLDGQLICRRGSQGGCLFTVRLPSSQKVS